MLACAANRIRWLNRGITIRCTRSRGPRGFFCLQAFRRGPVIVDVITLNQSMRFRLSTMLLSLSLAIVLLAWALDEWRDRTSHHNEYVVASEIARFNGYNDLYGAMGNSKGSPAFERMRPTLLLNTVKSTKYLLLLPIPSEREILRDDYKDVLFLVAKNAVDLLGITNESEFHDAIIANGDLELLKWEKNHPGMKFNVQVLDPETTELKIEFKDYLTKLFQVEN